MPKINTSNAISQTIHKVVKFLHDKKYEILLLSLIQHLFIGTLLPDISQYSETLWASNLMLLGISSTGVFIKKGKFKNTIRNILFTAVFCFTLFLAFAKEFTFFYPALGIVYVMFFSFIFLEIMQFLVRPGYINVDIIVAAGCGYFLLIEISVFLMMSIFYINPHSFIGISRASVPATYVDFIYFCSITFTSIGFGDILPNTHYTKLLTSFLGISGQFYTVMLVGILISKFSSKR
jgi:hypothetical protein